MFTFPTLSEMSQSLRRVVPSLIPGARADFWPNNLTIITKIVAMSVYDAMLRARWVYRQRFVAAADGPHLDVHGAEIGVPRGVARPASGFALFTPSAGASVPIGTQFVSDVGEFYLSTALAVCVSSVPVTIPLIAQNPGAAGNVPAGLSIRPVETGLVALSAGGVFQAALLNGAEPESDEAYRARLLERMRARPRGGNADDYLFWVKESGVFNAAAIRGWLPSAGRVTIYPLKPGTAAARIPTETELQALALHIEKRRPMTAEVVLAQASVQTINITISALANADEATRREITAELLDMFDERAAVALPGESASFSRSWIAEAISRAAGEQRHILTAPSADVTITAGALPVLGTITYA